MLEFFPVAVFLMACGTSLLLTVLVRRVAPRVGLTDHPDSHRKLHVRPTPMGGGLAVFVATVGVLALLIVVPNPWKQALSEGWFDLLILLLKRLIDS